MLAMRKILPKIQTYLNNDAAIFPLLKIKFLNAEFVSDWHFENSIQQMTADAAAGNNIFGVY